MTEPHETPAPPTTSGCGCLPLLLAIGVVVWLISGFLGGDDPAASAPPSEGDQAVVSAMRACTDDVMAATRDVAAIDTASVDVVNHALRGRLSACAAREIAQTAPTWSCDDDGCYGSDAMGYSWDSRVEAWGCRNVSSDHC